ncbi:MAG: C-5 sterol desaturase [Alphaproteobacteria bacterium]|nr:MAG: C-5 sterol desaturase [Alphaproteobacteria bacterium]
MSFPDPVQIAIPLFIVAMIIEMLAIKRGARGDYDWRDTGTSLAMGLGNTFAAVFVGGSIVALGTWLWQFRLLDIPVTWWALALCFIGEDFFYYWFHRTAHRVRWFWASHVIHHSSQHYNLSTALRQTWTGFISFSFFFRLPLFLIGFPPRMILFCAGLNLVYQFFIHTESVRRLPKSLEWLLNTPSHHRVHHGTNARYLDRNYGGVFIVWDRLFGTFEAERDDEPVRYGIVRNLSTFNPLWVAFHEWVAIGADVLKTPGLRGKWMAIVGPPGWHSGTTADTIRAHWEAEHAAGQQPDGQRTPPAAIPAE